MSITPDGIQAAADREKAAHPVHETTGNTITAWQRRADTLNALVALVNDLVERVVALEGAPQPEPEPEPEPEPTPMRYAPRAYNSTPSADARFCMSSDYGVRSHGGGFIDEVGVTYDAAGRDLGGRSKTIVAELKGANSMDGREPCDVYQGPTGVWIGGVYGYPVASFER